MSFNSVKQLEGKKNRRKKIKQTLEVVSTFDVVPESSLNTVAEILTLMAAKGKLCMNSWSPDSTYTQ